GEACASCAMGMRTRHSDWVRRDPRWASLRYRAKRRDGWRCVECKAPGRLEVDHIKPVRDAPELAFELSNLQSLCPRCHSRKTRIECGLAAELDPRRVAWSNLVRELNPNHRKDKLHVAVG